MAQPQALHVLASSDARDPPTADDAEANKNLYANLNTNDEREKRALGADGDSEGGHAASEAGAGASGPLLIPNRYRWTAFALVIFFATGSSFAEAVLGPLKSTLLKQLRINSECVDKKVY